MHHIAIMNPKLGFINKILKGQKTIETRWYKHKIAPWNKLNKGDIIYFKNSGDKITASAEVERFEQFDNLSPEIIKELINKNFSNIGLDLEIIDSFTKKHIDKNYAIFIFLKSPKRVEPFSINKDGFGNAAAWLCTPKIESIVRIEK